MINSKFICLFVLLHLFACNKQKADQDLKYMQLELASTQHYLDAARYSVQKENEKLSNLSHEVSKLQSNLENRNPCAQLHILTIKGKQSRFSLDIGDHIKDAANSFTFDIAVDPTYYNKHDVGDPISDEFRVGSALLKGSFSSMKLKVIAKRIEVR
jgi:hypothetical protein